LGELVEKENDRPAAIAAVRTGLERDPHYVPAFLKLKDHIVDGSGDLLEAVALLEAGLEINSSSADLLGDWRRYTGALLRNQRGGRGELVREWFLKARDAYERVLLVDPTNTAFLNNLGNTHQALNEPAKALGFHLRALDLDPGDAATRLNLGNAHLMMGKPDVALTLYMQAVELDPKFREAWMSLAALLHRVGDAEGALEAGRRLGEIDGLGDL
jgi:tetratricopeptide (TPR) repeat protein